MLTHFLPGSLAQHLLNPLPFRLWQAGQPVMMPLQAIVITTWAGQQDGLQISLRADYDERHRAVRWAVSLRNEGQRSIEHLVCLLLYLELDRAPDRDFPRVRHLSGSYHYDAAYPPRSFRLHEERFMTHDHCKPVRTAGGYQQPEGEHMVSVAGSAAEHVPVLQLSLGPSDSQRGLLLGFEWSSRWHIEAGWAHNSFQGEGHPPICDSGQRGSSRIPS
jgi:hypothetical protein